MEKANENRRLTQEEIDAFLNAYKQNENHNRYNAITAPDFSTATFVLLMIFFFPAGLIYQSVVLAKAQVSIAQSLLAMAKASNTNK